MLLIKSNQIQIIFYRNKRIEEIQTPVGIALNSQRLTPNIAKRMTPIGC